MIRLFLEESFAADAVRPGLAWKRETKVLTGLVMMIGCDTA